MSSSVCQASWIEKYVLNCNQGNKNNFYGNNQKSRRKIVTFQEYLWWYYFESGICMYVYLFSQGYCNSFHDWRKIYSRIGFSIPFRLLSAMYTLSLVDFPGWTLEERVALLRLVVFYDMKFNSIRFHETFDGVITNTFVPQISRGLWMTSFGKVKAWGWKSTQNVSKWYNNVIV